MEKTLESLQDSKNHKDSYLIKDDENSTNNDSYTEQFGD
jgi:hypothetical protein